ncbi:MAG: hypothetical protein PW734_00975 [Verrucomicrobium sp.]|nr:hypothetical protein [Verrucomicrobium sp.]
MKHAAFLTVALAALLLPVPVRAATSYVLQGQSVYGYFSGGYLFTPCSYSAGTANYGATPITGQVLTTNGLITKGSVGGWGNFGGEGLDVGTFAGAGYSWVDINDITVQQGGSPPQPPTGNLILDKNSGGAGGVNLQWSVVAPPAS